MKVECIIFWEGRSVTCLDIGRVHVLFLCKSLTVWAHVGEIFPFFFLCARLSVAGAAA